VTTASKTKILGGLLSGLANPAAILLLYGDTGTKGMGANPCEDIGKRVVVKKKRESKGEPQQSDSTDE
jgi:hypothetical protein